MLQHFSYLTPCSRTRVHLEIAAMYMYAQKMLANTEHPSVYELGSYSPTRTTVPITHPVELQHCAQEISHTTPLVYNGDLHCYPPASATYIGTDPSPPTGAVSNQKTFYTFPSPPYSASFNPGFRNMFSPDSPSCSIGMYPTTIPEPPPPHPSEKPFVADQPSLTASTPVYFIPNPEPISPGPCLSHNVSSPTAVWYNNVAPKPNGPWSAPPISMQQAAFTYPCPNGLHNFSPQMSSLSAPACTQSAPMPPPLPEPGHRDRTHADLRWPPPPGMYFPVPHGYFEAIQRPPPVRCTCPNCISGVNAKATNPDGTHKKKQHICHYPACGKVYGRPTDLRAHIRWHTGERPFFCWWLSCKKAYTRLDLLQRHLRSHTGDNRLICSECSKRFMRSDDLKRHILTH